MSRGKRSMEKLRAMIRGENKYYDGPCKYGHDSEKYVTSGECIECRKERQKTGAWTIYKYDGTRQ